MKIIFSVILIGLFFSCQTSYEEPVIALDEYRIAEGFELAVIASEPFLNAPVAMDFDSEGRIWVAQMPGYSNDMTGSNEGESIGSIKILEDLDGDGVADHAKTFLDSLNMPRALAHVYGGLLYADPPFLYFAEIENDRPAHRIVVDSAYAIHGNPQHQTNGLMLNIDNWIYSARSNFRYQKKNGVWKKEPTTFRGQWSISHDNFGRLYYNNNSKQLMGDYMLPNRLIGNTYFTPKSAVNKMLTQDQRVYPLHPTAVNRGYVPGILNADSILVHTTSAAGLSVYRGGNFPEGYDQNVFVSIPEGNLIKRNILSFTGDSTIAEQAWEGKEFLAATDIRFRPVSLNNGPEGALYVVDMHLGVIDHNAFTSPYLRRKNKSLGLDTLTGSGRILRIRNNTKNLEAAPDFNVLNGSELVALLKNKNGWVRDRAQHYLVFKGMQETMSDLKTLALDTENELSQLHALYTMDGLDGLSFDHLVEVAKSGSDDISATALVLLERFASPNNSKKAKNLFETLAAKNSVTIDLYLSNTLGKWISVDYDMFLEPLMAVFDKHRNNPIFREAAISGLKGNEEKFLRDIDALASFNEPTFKTQLAAVIDNKKTETINPIFLENPIIEDERTAGAKLFFQICASCHGTNGNGIEGLAPPLMNSEHVADIQRLGRIILHGLQGPITVNGEQYEFSSAMPGLSSNPTISDKEIADITAYVSNAFTERPNSLAEEEVRELRATKPKGDAEYTIEELEEFSERGK